MKTKAKKRGPIGIAIHGGAGGDSDFIQKHLKEYRHELKEALSKGYKILKDGGSAVDAVEQAIVHMEDCPLFNAGRGAALNAVGEVEMSASLMDGEKLKIGSVAIIRNVKNPISLSKAILYNTHYVGLGDFGALNYARQISISLEPDAYFITEHQYDAYVKKRKEEFISEQNVATDQIKKKIPTHGTVGAVALDEKGNLAAGTSTGGTENQKEGRISDSSMIGAGTYAHNDICAISCTGDGEYIIQSVMAHTVAMAMEFKGMPLKKAVPFVLHQKFGDLKGDVGIIGIDRKGNISLEFNCDRMHRAWIEDGKPVVKIYKE